MRKASEQKGGGASDQKSEYDTRCMPRTSGTIRAERSIERPTADIALPSLPPRLMTANDRMLR